MMGAVMFASTLGQIFKPLYEALARDMDVAIFYSGIEGNRKSWGDLASQVRGAVVKKSWGFTWTFDRGGPVPDRRYFHATPGAFADLVRFAPDVVVTSNPGCILQIRSAAAQSGHGYRVMHIVELLDQALNHRTQ